MIDPLWAESSAGPVALRGGGVAARLAGGRLHLQHGPIDLIIAIDALQPVRIAAEQRAIDTFDSVLATLTEELVLLRQPITPVMASAHAQVNAVHARGTVAKLNGPVAQRMRDVTARLKTYTDYLTPMAAVAGAVADHVLDAIVSTAPSIQRAAVNNGGDIALWLAPDAEYRVGLVADLASGARAGEVCIRADMPVRGVATSGWPGRSLSRGIADAVTVLAADAATADCAATVIAGAVNVYAEDHVERAQAHTLDPDSDLGSLPVTVSVAPLSEGDRRAALDSGRRLAAVMHEAGHIAAVWIHLQGDNAVVGNTDQLAALRRGV